MSEAGVHMRCQRCGNQMDLRDPPPGTPWQPNQFWVCPKCSRHYWTTYPSPPGAQPPAATPPAIVSFISIRTNALLKRPETRAQLAKAEVEAVGNTPQEFAKFIGSETAKFAMPENRVPSGEYSPDKASTSRPLLAASVTGPLRWTGAAAPAARPTRPAAARS